jgi:hypothetical protein
MRRAPAQAGPEFLHCKGNRIRRQVADVFYGFYFATAARLS